MIKITIAKVLETSYLLCFLFGLFLGGIHIALADETITCTKDCSPSRSGYIGTVTLDLQCNGASPLTYIAQLSVNGVKTRENSKDCRSDLTADLVNLEDTSVNSLQKITANINNIGEGNAGAEFSNFFQVKLPDGYVEDLPSEIMASIAPGGTRVATTNYKFLEKGTYFVRVCADMTSSADEGVITEVRETNQCSAWARASVTGVPDLTASPATPNDATANVPRSFSVKISNIGTGGTADFSNFFQIRKAGITTDLTATAMASIGAGLDRTEYVSYTFPASGSYSIRACSDMTSSTGGGVITELNENNQCGDWSTVAVVDTPTFNCSGPTPANASLYSTDMNSLTVNTAKTYSNTDTAQKCEYSCEAGYTWNGTSCNVADLPDLTAEAVTPNDATVNVARIFSANINNLGTAGTGAGFSYFFQITPKNKSTLNQTAGTLGAIDIGGTRTATIKYNFRALGPYSVRVCADMTSPSDIGKISESIENNQCGDWSTVTVVDTSTFSCTGSTPANASLYIGDSDGLLGDTPKTYSNKNTSNNKCEYSCEEDYSWNGTSCERTVILPVIDFSVSSKIVRMNQSVSLSWTIQNLTDDTDCTIRGPGLSTPYIIRASDGELGVDQITSFSTYTLNCSSALHPDVMSTETVEVIPNVIEI